VNKKTKAMRLASSTNRCKSGERKLRWNQTGRPGAPGQNGQNGQNGSPGQPGTDATPVTTRDTKPGEVTTTSTAEVPLDGPTVTVEVPPGGANILLGAGYDAKTTGGGAFACGTFFEGTTRLQGAGCTDSLTYARSTGSFPIFADVGSHTYTVRYNSSNAAQTASFRNRTLAVSVIP
jgi:hypothetical protein